ncbi:MAG: ankyrin repeat domain-containing protein [Brevinema sp.]
MENQVWGQSCEGGDQKTIEKLLQQGFDINYQDSNGWTGLMVSAITGHIDIVKFLVANNADLNIKDNRGRTVFDLRVNDDIRKILSKGLKKEENVEAPSSHIPELVDTQNSANQIDKELSHWNYIKDQSYSFKQGLEYIRNALLETDLGAYQNYIGLLQQVRSAFHKIADYKDPIKIAIAAETSAGKSTFLNALLFGKDILEATFGETTKAVFEIAYGDQYAVEDQIVSSPDAFAALVKEVSQKSSLEQQNTIKLYVPSPLLKEGIVLFDTPGYSSVNEGVLLDKILECANDADIVIFLADISRGLKKSDMDIYRRVLYIPEHAKYCYLVLNKLDAIAEQEEFEDSVFDGDISEIRKIMKEDNTIHGHIEKILEDMRKEVGTSFVKDNVIPLSAKKFLTAPKSAFAMLFQDFQNKLQQDIAENENYYISMRADLPRKTAAKLIGYIERTFDSIWALNRPFFDQNFPNLRKDFPEFMDELSKDTTTILNIDLYDPKKAQQCFNELDTIITQNLGAIKFSWEIVLLHKNTQLFLRGQKIWATKVNQLDSNSKSLLHYACETENDECIKVIINAGGNVLTKSGNNQTPFDLLVRNKKDDILVRVASMMPLDKDIFTRFSIDQLPQFADAMLARVLEDKVFCSEVLCDAIERNDQRLIEKILDKNPRLDTPNMKGETPLFTAVRVQNKDILDQLLKMTLDLNMVHWKTGEHIIEYALKYFSNVVPLLLMKGARPPAMSKAGKCLLEMTTGPSDEVDQALMNVYEKGSTKSQELIKFLVEKRRNECVVRLHHVIEDHNEIVELAFTQGNMELISALNSTKGSK